MSGKDVCLVLGTAGACGILWYFWTKRQTDLIAFSASSSQSDSSRLTSTQDIPEKAEEYARLNSMTSSKSEELQISSLNCADLEEDRGPVDDQWFDAVILHALEDETDARLCKEILQEHINVPNLKIGLPDDIILPGTHTLNGLASLISNCRLVIIYHSRYMSMDGLMLFGKQANIIQSLEDPQKRDRIIPFIVDGEEISVDMITIQSVNYTNDIRSANFPSFQNKMKRLFLMWREKIA